MKIAYNCGYGMSINLSAPVEDIYNLEAERLGLESFCSLDTPRHCPLLTKLVEKYGDAAGEDVGLKTIEGTAYRIERHDNGGETVFTPETEHTYTYINI